MHLSLASNTPILCHLIGSNDVMSYDFTSFPALCRANVIANSPTNRLSTRQLHLCLFLQMFSLSLPLQQWDMSVNMSVIHAHTAISGTILALYFPFIDLIVIRICIAHCNWRHTTCIIFPFIILIMTKWFVVCVCKWANIKLKIQ